MGSKNADRGPEASEWKAIFVALGNNVRNALGAPAEEEELFLVATSLLAIRVLIA